MKPLVEHAEDATEERLAQLFETAEPASVDPFRKRRILVRIERGEGRRLAFWLRPAIIAALLVSGTAAAALGKGILAYRLHPPSEPAAPAVVVAAPAAVRPAAVLAVATPEPASQPEPTPLAEPAAPDPVAVAPKSARRSALRARPGSEDPSDVVEAIQALRNDRDPSRAQALLSDYLQSHPKGQLSEDALALSIEAAAAKKDPRAADYARRYLSKFPHGRYRDVALRALAR